MPRRDPERGAHLGKGEAQLMPGFFEFSGGHGAWLNVTWIKVDRSSTFNSSLAPEGSLVLLAINRCRAVSRVWRSHCPSLMLLVMSLTPVGGPMALCGTHLGLD